MEPQNLLSSKVLRLKRMDGLVKRNATYADLDDVPEGKVGQLIDGDLYVCTRPRVRHALAISKLLSRLRPAEDDPAPKGWLFLLEVEIWFGKNRKNLLVPDIGGWRRSRLPADLDIQTLETVPDWICEGLSPSTTRIDRGRKRELYAKYGVKHLWYADPKRREVEMLTLDRASYRVTQIASNGPGVFAPFSHEIDIAQLWKA
jgi:Uma2 family endonuclease